MPPSLALTGATGFLGWHVRVLTRALGRPDPVTVDRDLLAEPERLARLVDGAERVLHVAGASRGSPAEIVDGNTGAATALAAALPRCATPPKTVVYANSISAGDAGPYGSSKAAAAAILDEACRRAGSHYVDVRLPNLFGEHGRPQHNSFVATFCRTLVDGGTPRIVEDREVPLLHVTDAAELLLTTDSTAAAPHPATERRTVGEVAERLGYFADVYRGGDVPALRGRLDVRLFNTYRSHRRPGPVPLVRRGDVRGELVETVRIHGGGGQVFCSSTAPGHVRGEHFHLAKVERFVVLRGEAEIRMRRLLDTEVVRFRVDGTAPVAVDMPTMWAHNIVNVGDTELLTQFWTNELLDPAHPDTYAEPVG
jgi:UDP-2-acetamido-2,6-beta-L-arabino-hexul-4-ose reductase